VLLACVALCQGLVIPTADTKLAAYNVNINDTSVSGLSAGGYMAVQMHMAYSDIMRGSAVFAGGPFHCAQGSMTTALTTCMTALPFGPNVNKCIQDTTSDETKGLVANTKNLANQTVYMYSGTMDSTVKPAVMQALYQYYTHWLPKDRVHFEKTIMSAHTQPTDDPKNTNPCFLSAPPYLSNCHYDGAGKALETIYGKLKPRNDGAPTGEMIKFDQSEFCPNPALHSMDSGGYAYVPANCSKGERCTLHIALHGCVQYFGKVGDAYITRAGYNKWADTNNFIVLYPQTVASTLIPMNPNGCWDWWGYLGNPTTYDTNRGPQMMAIREMITRVSSGYRP